MLNLSAPYQLNQQTVTDVRFTVKPYRDGSNIKLRLTGSIVDNHVEKVLTESHLAEPDRAFCQMAIACCEGTMEAATP